MSEKSIREIRQQLVEDHLHCAAQLMLQLGVEVLDSTVRVGAPGETGMMTVKFVTLENKNN